MKRLIHAYIEVETFKGPEPNNTDILKALRQHLASNTLIIPVDLPDGKFESVRLKFQMGDAIIKMMQDD